MVSREVGPAIQARGVQARRAGGGPSPPAAPGVGAAAVWRRLAKGDAEVRSDPWLGGGHTAPRRCSNGNAGPIQGAARALS